MGFANVREEPYQMPVWQRGEEKAWLTGPFLPQSLAITALGNSGSTGPKGIEGEIAYFASFDALVAAADSAVKGKIVFIDNQMEPTQDGSGYGLSCRGDRKSVVEGTSVSVRVDLGGRRLHKKKKTNYT